jgi:hypothetical protein
MTMQRTFWTVLVTALLAVAMPVLAAVMTLGGGIIVDKNKDGTITSCVFVTPDSTTYQVKLDAKGLQLAKEGAGQTLDVKGDVTKDPTGKNHITVSSFTIQKDIRY